jgi:hypothetical protein
LAIPAIFTFLVTHNSLRTSLYASIFFVRNADHGYVCSKKIFRGESKSKGPRIGVPALVSWSYFID